MTNLNRGASEAADGGGLAAESMTLLEEFATCGLDAIREMAARRRLTFGFEKSVRLEPELFETRRGLLSFAAAELQPDLLAELLHLCRQMHAPQNLLGSLTRFCPAAAFVHFGFERSRENLIGKCYLELPVPTAIAADSSGRLQFLGFKWSMQNASVAVVSRYRTLPPMSRVAAKSLLIEGSDQSVRHVVGCFLEVAVPEVGAVSEAVDVDQVQALTAETGILEIEEEGSERRSWDINVADHNVAIGSVRAPVCAIAELMNVPAGPCLAWLDQFAPSRLGHFATGVTRGGRPFVTLYYDAHQIRG